MASSLAWVLLAVEIVHLYFFISFARDHMKLKAKCRSEGIK